MSAVQRALIVQPHRAVLAQAQPRVLQHFGYMVTITRIAACILVTKMLSPGGSAIGVGAGGSMTALNVVLWIIDDGDGYGGGSPAAE